ncbi:MAG: IreB family regulatory phosphoprotein [Oscillospiraceae bacterium]
MYKTKNEMLISEIYEALQEKGYNPAFQLVGYILSEDPTYITDHKGARAMAAKLDRDALLLEMVTEYIGKNSELGIAV